MLICALSRAITNKLNFQNRLTLCRNRLKLDKTLSLCVYLKNAGHVTTEGTLSVTKLICINIFFIITVFVKLYNSSQEYITTRFHFQKVKPFEQTTRRKRTCNLESFLPESAVFFVK